MGVISLPFVLVAWGSIWLFALCVAIVILTLPLSPTLAGRVLILGCAALAWTAFLWFVPMPGSATRLGGFAALLAGGSLLRLAFVRRGGRRPRGHVLPEVRLPEAVLAAAIGFVFWSYAPIRQRGDGVSEVARLLDAFDHVSHFNMTEMVRSSGSPMSQLPAESGLALLTYPQGYHGAAAAVMEVRAGAGVSLPAVEVTLYVEAMIAVCGLSIVVLVAAICANPVVRRHPWMAAPAVAAVIAVFLQSKSGAGLLYAGFPNFIVACALLSVIPVVVVGWERIASVREVFIVSACFVGIAANWSILLLPAVFATLPLFFPLKASRWVAGIREWTAVALMIVVSMIAAFASVAPLLHGGSTSDGSFLLAPGDFLFGDVYVVKAVVGIGVLAPLALRIDGVRDASIDVDGGLGRASLLFLMPLSGSLVAGLIAVTQLRGVGALHYYFFKFLTAVSLSAAVVAITSVIYLVGCLWGSRGSARGRSLASVLASACLLSLFGSPFPVREGSPVSESFGTQVREIWTVRPTGEHFQAAHAALAACTVALERDNPMVLLPEKAGANSGRTNQLSNLWMLACAGEWTVRTQEVVAQKWPLPAPASEDENVDIVRDLVAKDNVDVAVPLVDLAAARSGLRDDELQRRLVAW